jgi:hypothetical protein
MASPVRAGAGGRLPRGRKRIAGRKNALTGTGVENLYIFDQIDFQEKYKRLILNDLS